MLHVNRVSFAYDEKPVLEDIHFQVGKGEHVAIMGESGCGKSTLLKIIYGLLHVNVGEVTWNSSPVKGPLYHLVPGEPFMKYMSQDFDLMPFTTVEENISEFLSVFYPEELQQRTQELLGMIEMREYAKTKVKHLSVGQQQRVALARVLAQKPEVLLLDEPFSHIDNFQKNSLRRNLFHYLKAEQITCLTATHDYNDVLPFAERIIVLKDHKILAKAPTLELYENPGDLYTASLFGEANLIPINVVKSYADTTRRIIVYAHEFKISQNSGLPVEVQHSYPMGNYYLIKGVSDEKAIYFHSATALETGIKLFLNIALETINKRLNAKQLS